MRVKLAQKGGYWQTISLEHLHQRHVVVLIVSAEERADIFCQFLVLPTFALSEALQFSFGLRGTAGIEKEGFQDGEP